MRKHDEKPQPPVDYDWQPEDFPVPFIPETEEEQQEAARVALTH